MKQFEMYFANEYTEEIMSELSKKMDIHYEDETLKAAILERDLSSLKNIFDVSNGKNRLVLDCNNKDYIYSLVVLCDDNRSEEIEQIMLEWDNRIREEYGQELTDDINDVFGKNNTLLKSIENYYSTKIGTSI